MTSLIRIILIGFLIVSPVYAQGQTYDYSWKKRKKELLYSTLFWMSSHYINHITKNDGIEDFAELDVERIWEFDRSAVEQQSSRAARISDYTLYASVALPFITNRKTNGQGLSIALMGLQGFFIENGINKYVKTWTERPRPYVYREARLMLSRELSTNAERSFYSGHASGSAYFSFFAARTFADLNPDSKWKPIVWITAATLPAVTSYLRYKGGKHFPSDVIVGYAAGAIIGNYLPKLFRNENIKISSSSTGLFMSVIF